MKFEVGDWVFFEFELRQVGEVNENRVTRVSDGYGMHGGYSLEDRCFPLTLENKRISDEFLAASRRLHKEGASGLNYPDIHRWLVQRWSDAICQQDVNGALSRSYGELNKFVDDILASQKIDTTYGFSLLRTR